MTRVDFPALAPLLVANGYLPVPITPGTKACHERDWRNFRVNGADLSRFAGFGTGQLLGQVVAPDIDVLHPEAAEELARLCEVMLGAAPRRVGLAPKVLLLYRTQEPFSKLVTRTFTIEGYGERNRVEVLAEGQMAVAYAVHPDTGRPYTWSADNEPLAINVNDLVEVDASRVQAYLDAADAVLARYGTAKVNGSTNGGGAGNASDGGNGGNGGGDGERVDVEALVEGIRSGAVGWEDGCTRLVGVLIRKKLSGDAVVELFARRLTRVGWTVEQTEASLRKIHRSLTKAEERKTGADLLEGLVERTKKDPSAPLEDDVRAALAAMRESRPAEWVRLRPALKDAGCPVRELDKALDRDRRRGGGEGMVEKLPTHEQRLLGLAAEAELFQNEDGKAFVDVEVDGHRETWGVRSRNFGWWLREGFLDATDGAPSTEAMQGAVTTLTARARRSPRHEACVRVARRGEYTYLDLCDEAWRAVEIGPGGWCVVKRPPVRFTRYDGMRPLPEPVAGADREETLKLLRGFFNVADEDDFVRAVMWVMQLLHAAGPYTVGDLLGEWGSTKTTALKVMCGLIDPSSLKPKGFPRDEKSLFRRASKALIAAYDNVSGGMREGLSDELCRLSEGGSTTDRELYTDDEEVIVNLIRPVIISGINSVITRPDLRDRALTIRTKPITRATRRDPAELLAAYEADRPAILGMLLDAAAHGLEHLPTIKPRELPRMAGFTRWSLAWEPYLWPEGGAVWPAYERSIMDATEQELESNQVANVLRAWIRARGKGWEGTAGELLDILEVGGAGHGGDVELQPKDSIRRSHKTWPPTPGSLGKWLRTVAPVLRAVGIDIELDERAAGGNRTRMITISFGGAPA